MRMRGTSLRNQGHQRTPVASLPLLALNPQPFIFRLAQMLDALLLLFAHVSIRAGTPPRTLPVGVPMGQAICAASAERQTRAHKHTRTRAETDSARLSRSSSAASHILLARMLRRRGKRTGRPVCKPRLSSVHHRDTKAPQRCFRSEIFF